MANSAASQKNQSYELSPQIRAYLHDLLTESGVVTQDPVEREAMLMELYDSLDNFLAVRILDYLPTNKLKEFAELTEKDITHEEITKYLRKNIPDSDKVYYLAFAEFRDVYLKGAKGK